MPAVFGVFWTTSPGWYALYINLSGASATITVTPNAADTEFHDTPGHAAGLDSENTTITAPAADLAVSLNAQPHLGILVPYLSYTATTHNNGPTAATTATLTASLPAGKTATNLSSGCTSSPGTVTCTYATLAGGADATATFRLPLNILSLGHVTVTAARTASTPTDPNTANDSDSATCTVISVLLATCP